MIPLDHRSPRFLDHWATALSKGLFKMVSHCSRRKQRKKMLPVSFLTLLLMHAVFSPSLPFQNESVTGSYNTNFLFGLKCDCTHYLENRAALQTIPILLGWNLNFSHWIFNVSYLIRDLRRLSMSFDRSHPNFPPDFLQSLVECISFTSARF